MMFYTVNGVQVVEEKYQKIIIMMFAINVWMKTNKRFYKKGDDMIGTNNKDGIVNGRADGSKGKN